MSILKRKSGLTFIEVAIGVAILMFVLTSGYVAFDTLSKATLSFQMSNKARQKLQSVAEELRLLSTTNFFDLPSMVTKLESLKIDQAKIPVTVQIKEIDPQTRTREVVLTARWNDGREYSTVDVSGSASENLTRIVKGNKEKTLTFLVSPLKGVAKGGHIKIIIRNNENQKEGIRNVKASCLGMDTPIVSCYTEGDGSCELSNVALKNGLEITLDGGEKAVAYFDDGNKKSWTIVRNEQNISSPLVTYVYDQLAHKTAVVTGRVYDVSKSGKGAAGVVVALRPIRDLVIPSYTTLLDVTADGLGDDTSVIDAGKFQISGIVPGKYSLEIIGNENYIAISNNVDDVVNPKFFEINPGQTLNVDVNSPDLNNDGSLHVLKTVPRGKLKFNLTKTHSQSSLDLDNDKVNLNFVLNTPSGQFIIPNRTLILDPVAGDIKDFKNTFLFKDFYDNSKNYLVKGINWQFSNYAVQTSTLEVTPTTTKSAMLAPLALLADQIEDSSNWPNTYSLVSVQPTYFTNAPFIPVIGFNSNSHYLYRAIEKQWHGEFHPFMFPVLAPKDADEFLFLVHPNTEENPTNVKGVGVENNSFNILTTDDLGNVTGNIWKWDFVKNEYKIFEPVDGSKSQVYSYVWENGFGGVMHSDFISPGEIKKNELFLSHNYVVYTDYVKGMKHTFDMKKIRSQGGKGCWGDDVPDGKGGLAEGGEDCFGIPPNVPGSTTQIHFKNYSTPDEKPGTTFHIPFQIQEKVQNADKTLVIQDIKDDPVNISDFHLIAASQNSGGKSQSATLSSARIYKGTLVDLEKMNNYFSVTSISDKCVEPQNIIDKVPPASLPISPFEVKPGKTINCDFVVDQAATIYSRFAIRTDDLKNFNDKNYYRYVGPLPGVSDYQFLARPGAESNYDATAGYQVLIYRAVRGILTGQVTTDSGASISKATVSLLFKNKNPDQENPYITTTNENGEFSFPDTYITPPGYDNSTPDLYFSIKQIAYEDLEQQFHVYRTDDHNDEHYCDPKKNYPCWTLNHTFKMKLKSGASGF